MYQLAKYGTNSPNLFRSKNLRWRYLTDAVIRENRNKAQPCGVPQFRSKSCRKRKISLDSQSEIEMGLALEDGARVLTGERLDKSMEQSIEIEEELPSTAIQDQVNESQELPEEHPSVLSLDDAERDGMVVEDFDDHSDQSKLSFIMKEKLHVLTGDIRRRTSQVADEISRYSEEDEETSKILEAVKKEHRPSLMSLIGLQRTTSPDEDIVKTKSRLRRLLSSTIDPQRRRYLLWLAIVVTAFLYNAFVIPLRSSYPYQTESNLIYWLIADYTADVIYLIDMILIKPRLRFIRNGITVKEWKETTKRYLSSTNFKLDLLSLAPFDIMYLWTGPTPAWRVVRLCKLLSFWQFFNLLDNSFSNPYIIRITKTLAYMIYLIHCNSCVYYSLSAWQAFGQIAYRINNKWYLNHWVYNNQGNAYIRCFYFTTAVATSTGNNPAPTNVIEYIYMTFSWMMGVFVFALLLGQIRDIVSNARRNREQYRQTMDQVLRECKRLGLPKNIVDRVRDWFIYTWQKQKTLDEKRLIEKLPLKLQTDLALSVHYKTLSKVQLFQDCDRALLRELVLKLRPMIFLPDDMICKKGDVGKEMYIVNDGILQVVGGERNAEVFAELTEGSVFGEISLLAIGGNNRRTANIRSKGYSTLFVLSKEDLNDVIKDYPEAQQLLRRKAREMLKKDAQLKEEGLEKQKNLEKTCRISAHINTPRLLDTVVKTMPKDSLVAKQLESSESTTTIPKPSGALKLNEYVNKGESSSKSNSSKKK